MFSFMQGEAQPPLLTRVYVCAYVAAESLAYKSRLERKEQSKGGSVHCLRRCRQTHDRGLANPLLENFLSVLHVCTRFLGCVPMRELLDFLCTANLILDFYRPLLVQNSSHHNSPKQICNIHRLQTKKSSECSRFPVRYGKTYQPLCLAGFLYLHVDGTLDRTF